ncbi:tripartite tricarboxylate transporter substrate binding protein [Edaphobacillus lindanitolerans]|nr:tripartite tricarboxylate transporter substrate binding protein [Edaphobacillus lindanitolerans]
MKKLLLAAGIMGLAMMALTGCGSGSAKESGSADSDYPNKPIQLIVPWDAGGDTDAVNRIAAEELEKVLGQTVVVKNIAGGSGVIGSQEALSAKPDGYTLLAVHDSMAMSQLTGQASFGFEDFEPISLITSTYNMIATSPENPWNSMEDLVNDAKERPGEISYAASIGSISELEPALIQTAADIKFNIIGYDGTAQRMKAVVANDVALGSVSIVAGKDYVEGDRMKFLGYTGEERSDDFPDVPTLKEQGINVVSAANRGFVAPKGTPKEIIEKLNDAFEKVTSSDSFKERLESLGTEVNYKGTKDYVQFIEDLEKDMEESLKQSDLID